MSVTRLLCMLYFLLSRTHFKKKEAHEYNNSSLLCCVCLFSFHSWAILKRRRSVGINIDSWYLFLLSQTHYFFFNFASSVFSFPSCATSNEREMIEIVLMQKACFCYWINSLFYLLLIWLKTRRLDSYSAVLLIQYFWFDTHMIIVMHLELPRD